MILRQHSGDQASVPIFRLQGTCIIIHFNTIDSDTEFEIQLLQNICVLENS